MEMSSENDRLLLEEVRQIRQLLEMIAEPAIAQRDAKLREELRKIVAASPKKRESVFLMDGSRTQTQIAAETMVHKGELSTMVGKLESAGLLVGDKKHPQLAIKIPANFFDMAS
jgi:hypothetical protein